MNIFYLALANNTTLFIVILVCVIFLYYIIFKNYIYSVFDPLLLSTIFSLFGTTTVIFLAISSKIDSYYLNSYILTQIAFIIGFIIIKPLRKNDIISRDYISIKNDNKIVSFLYFISFILFVLAQFYSYIKLGIPVFNEEGRLATYSGGGGLGVLERIISITRPIILITILNKWTNRKINLFDRIALAVFILAAVFSGSKSALLEIIFISVLFDIFKWKDGHNKFQFNRIRLGFTIISVIGALIIITIQSTILGNEKSAFQSLINRFLVSGDVFMYTYTSDVLDHISNDNGLKAIFKDFLGTTRIAKWENLPKALGLDIWQTYHNNFEGIFGPNPRHNVFGIHYFGFYGAIFYSFLIGFISSFFRNSLYRLLPKGILASIIYILLSSMVMLRADIALQLKSMTNFIFLFIPLLLVATLLSEMSTKLDTPPIKESNPTPL